MDVDDIVLDDAPPLSQTCQTELRPSTIVLNNLLRRNCTGSGEWTHLVKQPDAFRCCVTDIEAAGELYRAVWRYTDVGLSVMERRLSPVTRMSIEIILGAHQLVASRQAERDLIRCVMEVLLVDLRDMVSRNRLPSSALTSFILRTPRHTGCSQRYWFHWPALAVSNRELTIEWCNQHWGGSVETGVCAGGPTEYIQLRANVWVCGVTRREAHVGTLGCGSSGAFA